MIKKKKQRKNPQGKMKNSGTNIETIEIPEDNLEIEISSIKSDFVIDDGASDGKSFDLKGLSEETKSKEKEEKPQKKSSRKNGDKKNVSTNIEKIEIPEDYLEIDDPDFTILRTLAEYDEEKSRLMRKGGDSWECTQCSYTSSYKGHLREHVEKHIEGFLVSCDICQKTFTKKRNLRRHQCDDI